MTRMEFLHARKGFVSSTIGLIILTFAAIEIQEYIFSIIMGIAAFAGVILLILAMLVDDNTRLFLHTNDVKLLDK